MKRLICSLLFVCSGFAQQAVSLPSLTVSPEAVEGIQNWMLTQRTGLQLKLAADIGNVTTSIVLVDASSLVVGDVLVIEAEAVRVTVIAANVVTITRNVFGTIPAAHVAATATITTLKYRSIAALFRQIITDAVGQILEQSGSTTITAQKAAIQSAQQAIQTVKGNAVK